MKNKNQKKENNLSKALKRNIQKRKVKYNGNNA